jgi:hypothetical protein
MHIAYGNLFFRVFANLTCRKSFVTAAKCLDLFSRQEISDNDVSIAEE